MALNGVLPATTVVMSELSTNFETAQLVLTMFLIASLVSQLIMGPLADQRGRRPVMLLNLAIFTLGSVVCAIAPSIEWLLFGRFIQGIGVAACVFLPRTIVRDIYSSGKAASVIGYMTTAMMIAPMFGPAMGGWITDNYSWRFMYTGLAVLGCFLLMAAFFHQHETLASLQPGAKSDSENDKPGFLKASGVLIKDRRFQCVVLMQTGAVGVYYAFLSGGPYVAIESRGMSASSYGAWFSMVAVGYISGNFVAGRLSERLGVERMILLSLVPYLVGVSLFWFLYGVGHPVGMFLPMLILAFSNGMSIPSMITLAMSIRPTLAASASGLTGSVQTAFAVLLSLVSGYLLPFGDYWLQILLTISAVISCMGMWLCIRQGIIAWSRESMD